MYLTVVQLVEFMYLKEKFLVQFQYGRWDVFIFAKKYFNHALVRGINDILE